MRKCAICGKKTNVSLFGVPYDDRRKMLWEKACNMKLKATAKVCSEHFLPSDIRFGAQWALMPSAVPSIGIVSIKKEIRSIENKFEDLPDEGNLEESTDLGQQHRMDFLFINPEMENFEICDDLYEGQEEDIICAEAPSLQHTCRGTQTDNDVIISNSELENYKLRQEVRKLKAEVTKLKKELLNANTARKNICTCGQIPKMKNQEKAFN